MTDLDTTEDQKTLDQFIAEHGLTMTSEPVPENPNMSDPTKGMRHFYCTISAPSIKTKWSVSSAVDEGDTIPFLVEMKTYYSVGPGIVESWLREHGPWSGRQLLKTAPRCVDAATFIETHGKKYRPELADVLDCLAMDTCGADESFEDWAGELGYDADSRKAEAIYRACQDNARQLRNLLGHEALETLVFKMERL